VKDLFGPLELGINPENSPPEDSDKEVEGNATIPIPGPLRGMRDRRSNDGGVEGRGRGRGGDRWSTDEVVGKKARWYYHVVSVMVAMEVEVVVMVGTGEKPEDDVTFVTAEDMAEMVAETAVEAVGVEEEMEAESQDDEMEAESPG
jgi:hypothetical protein